VPDLIPEQSHAQVQEDDTIAGRAQHLDKIPTQGAHNFLKTFESSLNRN
jgi:hypothetical protein